MKKMCIILLIFGTYKGFSQTKFSFRSMEKNEINVSMKMGAGVLELEGNKVTGNSKSVNVSFNQKLGDVFYLSAGLGHTRFEFNNVDYLLTYDFIQIPVLLKTDLVFLKETEENNKGYFTVGLGLSPNYLYSVNDDFAKGWNVGYISNFAFRYELSDLLTSSIGIDNSFDISKIDNLKMRNNTSFFISIGCKF